MIGIFKINLLGGKRPKELRVMPVSADTGVLFTENMV